MIIKVNTEKETVTAIIANVRKQLRNTVAKVHPELVWMEEVTSIIDKIPDTCVGIAKCSATDEWDEQTGVDIARNRAIRAHARTRAKTMRKIRQFVARTLYSRLNTKILDAEATAWDCEDMLDACIGK